MKLKTQTGSMYIIENNTVTRISESPVFDNRNYKVRPDAIFNKVPYLSVTLEIGKPAIFVFDRELFDPAKLTTSPIVEIMP